MRHLFLLLVAGVSLGCADLGEEIPPDVPLAQLRAAPDTIVVEGRFLFLTTYLWRDFMPISPPEGKPLIAIVYITATDSAQLPGTITADAIWIVNDTLVWKGWFTNEPRPPDELRPNRIVKVARNGPTWGPHLHVDVVVRILDGRGTGHLVRASHQWIDRTD